MEQKKHNKVNLENKRGLYSAIGLLMASAIVLVALEYRTLISTEIYNQPTDPFEQDDIIEAMPISIPKAPKKPQAKRATKTINQQILTSLIDETGEEEDLIIEDIDIKAIETNLLATNDFLFSEEDFIEENIPLRIPQIMAEYIGGEDKMYDYLRSNITYPKIALAERMEGTVHLEFIIERDGSINEIVVLRDEVGGGCAEEAIRVVKNMPNWKPGSQMGKKVRVKFYLPIHFNVR